jgi:hypothetical protein
MNNRPHDQFRLRSLETGRWLVADLPRPQWSHEDKHAKVMSASEALQVADAMCRVGNHVFPERIEP